MAGLNSRVQSIRPNEIYLRGFKNYYTSEELKIYIEKCGCPVKELRTFEKDGIVSAFAVFFNNDDADICLDFFEDSPLTVHYTHNFADDHKRSKLPGRRKGNGPSGPKQSKEPLRSTMSKDSTTTSPRHVSQASSRSREATERAKQALMWARNHGMPVAKTLQEIREISPTSDFHFLPNLPTKERWKENQVNPVESACEMGKMEAAMTSCHLRDTVTEVPYRLLQKADVTVALDYFSQPLDNSTISKISKKSQKKMKDKLALTRAISAQTATAADASLNVLSEHHQKPGMGRGFSSATILPTGQFIRSPLPFQELERPSRHAGREAASIGMPRLACPTFSQLSGSSRGRGFSGLSESALQSFWNS